MDKKDKSSIIEKLAKDKVIEDFILNITGVLGEDERDLAQDLYLDLMNKDEELIQKMDGDGSIKYFISRMVTNNIRSKNSRYYYRYKKNKLNRLPLDGLEETLADE